MDMALVQLVDVLVNVLSSRLGSSSTATGHSNVANKEEVIRNSPAVKFLTRTDFFSLVQYSDVSLPLLDLDLESIAPFVVVFQLDFRVLL